MTEKVIIHLTIEVDESRADELVKTLGDLTGVRVLEAGPAPADSEISNVPKPDVTYIR